MTESQISRFESEAIGFSDGLDCPVTDDQEASIAGAATARISAAARILSSGGAPTGASESEPAATESVIRHRQAGRIRRRIMSPEQRERALKHAQLRRMK